MDNRLNPLVSARAASRLATRDASVFSVAADPKVRRDIEGRLGWLAAPDTMAAQVPEVTALVRGLLQDGLTDVYLLGMGGSSLCAEVLRDVAQSAASPSHLTVLDTTDERTIRDATESVVPEYACFLVASKSGSTIEVTSLERHFWSIMRNAGRTDPGRHFVAITDPGTPLVDHATSHAYRRVFVNPADIGGRYSALSLFGLVPAAMLGIDLEALLASGRRMAAACREDAATNPGLALGAFMAGHALAGRDKLTLLMAPELEPLGIWIEQLVAESTGKMGRGVLPIVGETPGALGDYGDDRVFVSVSAPEGSDVAALTADLIAAGRPVFRIEAGPADLGAEFVRWELATAVAGIVLDVNPFDEPNVREAKKFTAEQIEARRATGTFTLDPPFDPGEDLCRRQPRSPDAIPATPGRYVAILDYLPAEPRRASVVAHVRSAVRARSRVATTHGVGPRYLHSTGQYHKGGPNSGVFVLLTAADETATPVPGTDYTFSALKYAQALGDFKALKEAGREVIHHHVENPSADFSEYLERVISALR